MFSRLTILAAVVVATTPAWFSPLYPQVAPTSHDSTVTLSSSARSTWEPLVSSASPLASRMVDLSFSHVTVREALQTVGQVAGVSVLYDDRDLPAGQIVSLHVDHITIAAALSAILQGTNLDAYISISGNGILVRPTNRASINPVLRQPQGTATVSGSIRDSATGASIPRATIQLEGTSLETKSTADGTYILTGVPTGDFRLTVHRVGYLARARSITVRDGETLRLNFLLNPPPTTLDEVVTTAIGEQRRYQVGNVVSTINVDSLAPTAPVTSVTDLLSSRVPGLDVLETGGLVGSGESIRIRGESSALLSNDPIIIVDGIRVDNTPGGTNTTLMGTVPSPSRINDIDFTQVATINVLKGPAATTEYGTDAANGVIIITTKRGTSGKPQWNVSAERTEAGIPGAYGNLYYASGHSTDGNNLPVNCLLARVYVSGETATNGGCVVDSISSFNPLNHEATTIYHSAPSTKYDLSVSGGTDAIRYYVGGALSNALGAISLPAVFRSDALAIGFPTSSFSPNSENQRSVRLNTLARLTNTMDLTITAAYLSTYHSSPGAGSLNAPGLSGEGPLVDDSLGCYGYCEYPLGPLYGGTSGASPLATLGNQANQLTNSLTGGMNLNWRLYAWLTANATVGVVHESNQAQSVLLPQSEAIESPGDINDGAYEVNEGTTDIYTADLRASATAALSRLWRSTTTVGTNIVDTRDQGVDVYAGGLPSTNLTINGAPYTSVSQSSDRSATLGGYIDEQVAFADRLFLDGSLRLDAGSGFGHSYHLQAYHGAQVSWLVLNGGSTTLRIRGSVGESGVQPSNGSSQQIYQLGTTWYDGAPIPANAIQAIGNPLLKPERSVEYEGGFDLGLWGDRLTLGVTGYSKTTFDDLVDVSLGADILDGISTEENLGTVRNSGVELTASIALVRNRALTWVLGLNGAINSNKLIAFAPEYTGLQSCTYVTPQCMVAGYPMNGFWSGQTMSYHDLNHDGIIEPNEVTVTPVAKGVYKGASLPNNLSAQSTWGFWRNTVSVGAVVDYSGGYEVYNAASYYSDYSPVTEANYLATAPLWQQARIVNTSDISTASYVENGTYVSFRELNLTYALPRTWLQPIHLSNLSVTGAVRNLALWTRYPGDPESSNAPSGTGSFRPDGFGAVSLARTWFLRLNMSF